MSGDICFFSHKGLYGVGVERSAFFCLLRRSRRFDAFDNHVIERDVSGRQWQGRQRRHACCATCGSFETSDSKVFHVGGLLNDLKVNVSGR